jgi:hypothetical protein
MVDEKNVYVPKDAKGRTSKKQDPERAFRRRYSGDIMRIRAAAKSEKREGHPWRQEQKQADRKV